MIYKRISANKGDGDAWIRSASTCQADGPVLLETGESRTVAEARGDMEKLGDIVRFCVWNPGQWADLVWTGDMILVASDRLIEALTSLRAQEFTTFPISIHEQGGGEVKGYQGFVPSEANRGAEIHSFHADSPHFAFVMSESLLGQLRSVGIDGFEVDEVPDWFPD